jgi:hypothetical protein
MWHIEPLLGNERETNNDTTAIPRQQLCKYETVLELLLGSGPRAAIDALLEAVFLWAPSEAISLDRLSWVSWLIEKISGRDP